MSQLYRSGSPVFDVPDYPQLRRVKPLPKRRRMADPIHYQQPQTHSPPDMAALQAALGQNVGPEDFAAHADALSTQLAMQSFYMPMFNESFDFIQANLSHLNGGDGLAPMEFPQAPPMPPMPPEFAGGDEDEHGEGDYIDHLTQPGLTKKRKGPVANLDSPGGHDTGSVNTGGEGNSSEKFTPTGPRPDNSTAAGNPSATPLTHALAPRGRTSAATQAGLQHKEMLKNRKRQLAAVLGALSHGDPFALDQALSARYPFAKSTSGTEVAKADAARVRLSRRPTRRLARSRALTERRRLRSLPHVEFEFICPSATSERLSATKEEVAALHSRFEAELTRQAEKAAEAAKAAALAASNIAKKAAQRSQTRPKAIVAAKSAPEDAPLANGKPRTGKKKKRSAMANASNPHHLRNYVPSRLPHSGPQPTNQENLLFPFPLRFLSAEIPPRRRQKAPPATVPASQLTNPYDEWICPFCESNLFYGDEQEYKRSVRSRKKILARRRRARERAAAAASGTPHHSSSAKGAQANDENPGFDPSYLEADAYGKQARIATGRGGGDGHSSSSSSIRDRDKSDDP